MKILFVTEYFPSKEGIVTGGVERRVLRLTQEFSKKHEVTVLAANTTQPKEGELFGFTVVRCGPKRLYTSKGSFIARFKMLWDMVNYGRKHAYDVIETTNATVYAAGFLLGIGKRSVRIAWIPDVFGWSLVMSLGLSGFVGLIMERIGILLPWNHWIALSKITASKLRQLGVPDKKITVVYGGVDLPMNNSSSRRKLSILTVARLVAYKRAQDVISALSLVLKKIPKIKLLIVGEGPEKDTLIKLVRELKLTDSISFLGNVTEARLRKLNREAKVLCAPSVIEGFGLSVVEGLAAGTPYIVTNTPINQEVLGEQGGLFFAQTSVSDLAEKLALLLTDNKLWAKKQEEAYLVAKKYTWSRIARETLSVYNTLRKGDT